MLEEARVCDVPPIDIELDLLVKVAAMPEYKRFVLADLENDTRKAYEACQASKRRPR